MKPPRSGGLSVKGGDQGPMDGWMVSPSDVLLLLAQIPKNLRLNQKLIRLKTKDLKRF